MLFRGLIYGGFRRSFGGVSAAVLCTSLFVLIHISEIKHYWPAAIGVTGMAVTMLWLRLRSSAIGPSIAAHVSYNLLIVLIALSATLIESPSYFGVLLIVTALLPLNPLAYWWAAEITGLLRDRQEAKPGSVGEIAENRWDVVPLEDLLPPA